jgi:hypothetical protein
LVLPVSPDNSNHQSGYLLILARRHTRALNKEVDRSVYPAKSEDIPTTPPSVCPMKTRPSSIPLLRPGAPIVKRRGFFPTITNICQVAGANRRWRRQFRCRGSSFYLLTPGCDHPFVNHPTTFLPFNLQTIEL